MIESLIAAEIVGAVKKLYNQDVREGDIQLQKTRKDFDGDITLVVFPLTKVARKAPHQIAEELGSYLLENVKEIYQYNVVKGFLNLSIHLNYWTDFLSANMNTGKFGFHEKKKGDPVVIEFSSPNTNKPLHLGHIRNNLLGYSVAKILEANGYHVIKVNLVNNRGIHISKTMFAYEKWGERKTPEQAGVKGDKLVGDLYVRFDKEYKEEIGELTSEGYSEEEAAGKSTLMEEVRNILKKWEAGDDEVRSLWEMMNSWVYAGFDRTYKRLGIDFDTIYYESDTYLLGRVIVEEGLKQGVFFRKEDGSIWADLIDDGLDEKILLRADGTSVYMTQDLGTAQLRYDDYHPKKLLYVVGNEQNYHFDVLKIILKKLGRSWADNITHISYGMVELPHGKMKSREGTVVDADDLMEEMHKTARKTTLDLGKIENFNDEEANQLFEMLGLGALKYFILKVDPKKNMLFNPEESIRFDGNTGPFIQYTYARIQSLLRKATEKGISINPDIKEVTAITGREKEIIKLLHDFPGIISQAGLDYSPAQLANYIYELVKEYNGFYQDTPVLKENDHTIVNFRLLLSRFAGQVIKSGMDLLGIQVPDRM